MDDSIYTPTLPQLDKQVGHYHFGKQCCEASYNYPYRSTAVYSVKHGKIEDETWYTNNQTTRICVWRYIIQNKCFTLLLQRLDTRTLFNKKKLTEELQTEFIILVRCNLSCLRSFSLNLCLKIHHIICKYFTSIQIFVVLPTFFKTDSAFLAFVSGRTVRVYTCKPHPAKAYS